MIVFLNILCLCIIYGTFLYKFLCVCVHIYIFLRVCVDKFASHSALIIFVNWSILWWTVGYSEKKKKKLSLIFHHFLFEHFKCNILSNMCPAKRSDHSCFTSNFLYYRLSNLLPVWRSESLAISHSNRHWHKISLETMRRDYYNLWTHTSKGQRPVPLSPNWEGWRHFS